MSKYIYAVSDSAGETAEAVARAAASQFASSSLEVIRVPFLCMKSQIDEVVEKCINGAGMIIHTVVTQELKEYMRNTAADHNVRCIDSLGAAIHAAEKLTEKDADMRTGKIRRLDTKYFDKIDAMQFAVKYDDGKDPRGFVHSDVVIVGISRTSKTPISMALAYNYSLKASNLPLVPEVPLPKEILQVPPKKIIGLVIDKFHLNNIRKSRMKNIGLSSTDNNYHDMGRIEDELAYAMEVYRYLHCRVVDVTNKSIEESATTIASHLGVDNVIETMTD